jgi:CheY-like chemotaxis protein
MLTFDSILLIDDDEDANFLNRILIEKLGITAQVVTLTSGKAALDYIAQNFKSQSEQAVRVTSVFFVDISMPEMSGYEFLRRFEELPDVDKQGIRIYLLTSLSHPADLEQSKHYNIDGILAKPLTRDKLISLAQEKNSPVL